MKLSFSHLLICLAGLTAAPTLLAADTAGWFTYEEWHSACEKLPSNRSLAGRFPDRSEIPLRSFDQFEEVLDAFIGVSTNGPLGDMSLWVGPQPAPEEFFNIQRAWFLDPPITFQPFAQKLLLPDNARAVIQGDLHGDIRSLLTVLDRLQERGILEGFQLQDSSHHMFFTGDFTDRGAYGIEVLYTLFRLKIANPEQVHFARGNHEDLELVANYGFFPELRTKYGTRINVAKLLRAYDFLPVVLYVGCSSNVVQMNHGGMEPGFDPRELLTADGATRFQLIGALNQRTYHEAHADWLGGDPTVQALAEEHFQNFTPTTPTRPSVIGFMWNDFTVLTSEPNFDFDPGRAYIYGSASTRHLLRTGSTKEVRIRAVIRAHQHSGLLNPMMRRLVASDGLFQHWQEADSTAWMEAEPTELRARLNTSTRRRIPDGSVWTFNVSPDSIYGAGCDFDFVTYGILGFQEDFPSWEMEVFRITVE